MLGLSNPDAKDNTPEAGAHIVDLGHVTSHGIVKVVYHQKERIVVHVPRVEGEVQNSRQAAGTCHRTALEQLPADEMATGKVTLPEVEDGEQADANDHHSDELGLAVACESIRRQRERQQKQDEGGCQDQAANDVELVDVVDDGPRDCPATRLMLVKSHPLGLDGVELEDNSQGGEDEEHNDDKGTVAPTPGGHL